MVDLTKYYGNEGIVVDKNFAFSGTSKSITDLISEMKANGLLVDFIDTTGVLVRVPVMATVNTRPDKSGERSGYYVYNQLDNNFVCIYGNWRTSQEWKFTSFNPNEMTVQEKRDLQAKLEEAQKRREEAKKQKHKEVAEYSKEKFNLADEVTEHKYLKDKKINHTFYTNGLKTIE